MTVRTISSRQTAPHENLRAVVEKHLAHAWKRPLTDHTRNAFEDVVAWLGDDKTPLILDSCCGTGESTSRIAEAHTDARVIGIDKSAARLGKSTRLPANALIVRADANDFWRLLSDSRLRVEKHFLLYPNPYPKPAQLTRRWHGSPAFPALVALGGQLTVRSNWLVYVEEFAQALEVAGFAAAVAPCEVEAPMTAFERKYAGSNQPIWQLTADLSR